MRATQVVWTKKSAAEVQPFEPASPGEGQVLVRTDVSLISSGTERAFFTGMPNTSGRFPTYAPGYSNVGRIVQLGPKVEGLNVGQRVACNAGHASHHVSPAGNCFPIAQALPDEEAVFFNLVSIALQGVRKARIELGEPVVVIGAGMVGLLAMQLARLQGAMPAVMVDRDARRSAAARQFGADASFVLDDHLAEAVNHACAPAGPAVVIEATGAPQPIVLAFQLARPMGRVVILSGTRGETEKVNFYRDLFKKGLTVIGAQTTNRPLESMPGWWTAADDWRTALRLLELKRVVTQPLITHRFAAGEAPKAYKLLAEGGLDAMAIILNWS